MNYRVLLLADVHGLPVGNENLEQEWESRDSVEFLADTIRQVGMECIILEPLRSRTDVLKKLQEYLPQKAETILFNLVEGFSSPSRESYVPALAEFLGFPFTGSTAYAQSVSLDKHLTKLLAKELNILTADSEYLNSIPQEVSLTYPVFLKPVYEGSSLGVTEQSRVRNFEELKKNLIPMLKTFGEVLAETFIRGEDYTVGVFGNPDEYRTTKVARLVYPGKVYSCDIKSKAEMPEKLVFDTEDNLEKLIQKESVKICRRLKVRGYARLDFMVDPFKSCYFLEINLTPGLSYRYSSLPICYKETFGSYRDMVNEILHLALESYSSQTLSYGTYEIN